MCFFFLLKLIKIPNTNEGSSTQGKSIFFIKNLTPKADQSVYNSWIYLHKEAEISVILLGKVSLLIVGPS